MAAIPVSAPAEALPDPTDAPGAGSDLRRLVERLAADGRCAHWQTLPARPARFGQLDPPLGPDLRARLGIEALWSHQVEALEHLRHGRSVVIATGTASGKSLCFQAALAESAQLAVDRGEPTPTSLLLFPTKALARDQFGKLDAMGLPGVTAAAYDGDCGPDERAWARRHATTLLTNPEMLHHALLPNHDRWATFLARLQLVVVDELHVLRGVFGGHTAHLLRRLRRLCHHYGSSPRFVFCSATIGDPVTLASALAGQPVTGVTSDGSPLGERIFVLWNPVAGDAATGAADGPDRIVGRRSTQPLEVARLTAELVRRGHRTITFCRGRRSTELAAAEARRRLPPRLAEAVRPYRAGFLPGERRQIEQELFAGRLRGVVATSALELGVDVGGLDAAVLDGFPGTVASLWQQAGRVGRGDGPSLCLLVAGHDQLDQWIMAHPTEVFTRPPEPAVVNVTNPYILLPHLACAAYELPLTPRDERWWPDLLDDGVRQLVLAGTLRIRPRVEPAPLRRRPGRRPATVAVPSAHRTTASAGAGSDEPRAVWAGRGSPATGVGLRSARSGEFKIATDDGRLIGTVDGDRAFRVVHPGAVYVHDGRSWLVTDLDLDDRLAIVEPADGAVTTRPRTRSNISIVTTDEEGRAGSAPLFLGTIEVTSEVVGYQRLDAASGQVVSAEELELPPTDLTTRGFWFTFPPSVLSAASLSGRSSGDLPGALHAAEHAAIAMLPLFTICDRWDVGGLSTPRHADTGAATIVIHDGYPGGAGIAEMGFSVAGRLVGATRDLVEACGCEDGCPSCVQSPKCGNGNDPLSKGGAIRLLRSLGV